MREARAGLKYRQAQRETQSNGKSAIMYISLGKSFHSSSPVIWSFQLPATPQLRRALLENSSGSKSKMSIKNYHAKINVYRSSTAKVAFSTPFLISRRDLRLTQKLQGDQVLRINLLEGHRINPTDLDFVNLSKRFYPNGGDT